MDIKILVRALVASALLSIAQFSATAGAQEMRVADDVPLTPPPAPVLSAIPGGAIIPHSDYVRVTYVSENGETTPSADAVYSAGANTLTIVHSPPPVTGAVGYNVYAVKNLVGTAYPRQNERPIAIGQDYVEPTNGWSTSGEPAPASNSAYLKIPERVVHVDSTGGYFEAPIINGVIAAFVIPSNDATGPIDLSLTSIPGPVNGRSSTDENVIQTLGFMFSADVVLRAIPTLKLSLPSGSSFAPPFIVRVFDASSGHQIALLPGYVYRNLTFWGDFRAPFHALGHRRYYAELIASSPSTAAGSIKGGDATTIDLPSIGGISVSATLPAGTVTNGCTYSAVSASTPIVGLPAIAGPGIQQTMYYGSITVFGTVSYSQPGLLTVTLPPSLASSSQTLRLAAYDSQFRNDTWFTEAPVRIDGRTVTFLIDLPNYVGWRQYGFAFYRSNAIRPAVEVRTQVPTGAKATPTVVILGDSISRLTIAPPSGVGCTPGWGPLPECQYSLDQTRNWPGVLAQSTSYKVINLAALGTQTTVNTFTGESMLDMMVPQIPRTADVVVCQCG